MREINNLIFMGTPDFAVPCLQALIENGENIAAVVCQPDRRKGRGRKLQAPPVKALALKHDIPVLQPTKIKSEEFLDSIREIAPDLIVVAAYGRILPPILLDIPPLGVINVHGSLLPKYRGAAPIQRAIINGEQETGITIMEMAEGMDTGDILLTGSLPISEDDTSVTLAEKMAELGGSLLIQTLESLRKENITPQKQDDSQATMAPPLCKTEGRIDWNQPASQISQLIRGLDPWPKAHTTLGDKWLRLFRPRVINEEAAEEPGTVVRIDGEGLLTATGSGYLLAREVQLEGGKRMTPRAFIQGNPLKPGTKLGVT